MRGLTILANSVYVFALCIDTEPYHRHSYFLTDTYVPSYYLSLLCYRERERETNTYTPPRRRRNPSVNTRQAMHWPLEGFIFHRRRRYATTRSPLYCQWIVDFARLLSPYSVTDALRIHELLVFNCIICVWVVTLWRNNVFCKLLL